MITRAVGYVRSAWSEMTIEPAIFIYVMSGSLAFAAGQQTKLMLWKVCNVVMQHNSTVCDNLNHDDYDLIENEVQIFTNNFTIKDSLLNAWPAIIYVFFAGALSDKFGRKWLICLPVSGNLISTVFQIIHYMFIWLARFDGMEMFGVFLGTLLSPYLFNATGYYGVYIARLVMVAISLVYFFKVIKSPEELGIKQEEAKEKKEKEEEVDTKTKFKNFIVQYVVTPLKEFYVALTRKRENNLRIFLYINFAIYFTYICAISYNTEKYLYMVKVFDDFTGEKYAHIGVFERFISIVTLLVIVPFFLNKLEWHETSLEVVVCSVQIVSLTCAAFATNMIPQFALALGVSSIDSCQWALVRSVFTKMVDKDEVGKVYSFVAILTASLTLIAIPAMKKLYNATLTVFPSAFLLAGASLYALALGLNLVLFTFRSRYSAKKSDDDDIDENGNEVKKEEKKDVNSNEICKS